jgi:hypothetical protein
MTYCHKLVTSRVTFFIYRVPLCTVTIFISSNFVPLNSLLQFVPFIGLLIVGRNLFNYWFRCVSYILFLRFTFSTRRPILIEVSVSNLGRHLPLSLISVCVLPRSYSISDFAVFFIDFQVILHTCYKYCEPIARSTMHT